MRGSSSFLCLIMTVVVLLGVGLVPLQGSVTATPKAVATWTFMVYLDGDNNLESYGVDDFLEMSSVGSTAQVNILVQFDRSPLTDWSGGTSDYGDWRTAKRFVVERGDEPTAAYQSSDLGEVNMGSGAVLQSFLQWGMGNYPASNYALVLWDHGGGWVYGVCSDDTSSGDSLLLPEIRQAISSAESATGKRIGLVGFDACLMGMTEVAYELSSLTDIVVFSEETEPGQGWAYDKVLYALTSSPAMSAPQLGGVIVREYSQYYGSSGKETLSSVSTSAIAQVASSLDAFSTELSSAYALHGAQVQQARSRSEHFEYEMFVDLYDFAHEVRLAAGPALTNAADQLLQAIDGAVLSETNGNLRPGAHGLAIYFPDVISDLNLVGYRTDASLTKNTSWDEFLNLYFNGGGGGGGSDDFEDDGTYLLAKQLMLDLPQYRSIGDGGADLDWTYFLLSSPNDVVVQTSGVSGDTELFLFEEANVTSPPLAYDDDGGVAYFSRILAQLPAGKYYVKVGEYGGDAEIDSYQLSVSIPSAADGYEPDDLPEDASLLIPGDPQQHSIGDGGADVDWARFTLDSVKNVVVETSGVEGDTRMWLYEQQGDNLYEIDSDDDTGEALFSMITCNDLPAGEYYVKVEEYYNDHEISGYQLNLTSFSSNDDFEPDGDHLHATSLVPGAAQWHSIGDGGDDVDWFTFQLGSGSEVSLETYGAEGDTQMFLYSSAGVPSDQLASDDDSGIGYFSLLELTLAPGRYYVKVQAFQGFLFLGGDPIPRYGIELLTCPSAPMGFLAQLQGSQVLLNWTIPATDGGSPIDHYEVLRSSLAGEAAYYRSVTATSFLDVNVSAGADYYYEVRAVTSFGKGALSVESHLKIPGDLVVPGAITTLQAEGRADHISLSWQAPEEHGGPIIAYHILGGRELDGSDRMEIGSTSATSFTDEGVVEGGTYYYWVVAENGYGMGQMSASASATAADPGLGAGMVLLIILGGVGALTAILLVLLLWARRDKGPRGGAPVAFPDRRCPNCGADTMGHQYCGNCGKKLL